MRYPSIDILRMVAIFVMVGVHFAENLSGVILPIAGLGAPLFAFLAGLSYRLWVGGLERRNISDEEISKRSTRRGLFVFGAGFAFNIIAWLPEDTFNWDVLTFIGFSLLLLNGLRRLPLPIPVLIAVSAILISPILRGMADYPAYWENHYFECDLTLSDVLIGFIATGYFPIFPWMAYPMIGFVAGSLLFRETPGMDDPQSQLRWKSDRVKLFTAALMMLSTSGCLLFARPHFSGPIATHLLAGWTMFPPTIEYVLATIGMAMLLFGLLHQMIDRRPAVAPNQGFLEIAKTFSRYSFTIYVLHHLVHLWPMWIYALAEGKETTYYWRQALPLAAAIPLAGVFLVACYFTLRKIGPERRFGIEGWMRWLCD